MTFSFWLTRHFRFRFFCLMAYQFSCVILCHRLYCAIQSSIIEPIAVGVRSFFKCISLKVNVIARLEFEKAYFVAAIQHFNHYTMGTPRSKHYFSFCFMSVVCITLDCMHLDPIKLDLYSLFNYKFTSSLIWLEVETLFKKPITVNVTSVSLTIQEQLKAWISLEGLEWNDFFVVRL